MEERKLTPAEERERLKEQFKREMMEDKAKLEALRRKSLANQAENLLEQITAQTEADDSDIWMEKLNSETAVKESPLDTALEKFKQQYLGEQTPKAKQPLPSADVKVGSKTLGDEELLPDHSYPNKNSSDLPEAPPQPTKSLGDEEI